ncbi:MAG: hypothetical protein RL021_597, partial [Bacteroidota bacterium]
MASASLRERFFRHVAQTSDAPPGNDFVGAEGCHLIGADGRKYIDAISG